MNIYQINPEIFMIIKEEIDLCHKEKIKDAKREMRRARQFFHMEEGQRKMAERARAEAKDLRDAAQVINNRVTETLIHDDKINLRTLQLLKEIELKIRIFKNIKVTSSYDDVKDIIDKCIQMVVEAKEFLFQDLTANDIRRLHIKHNELMKMLNESKVLKK